MDTNETKSTKAQDQHPAEASPPTTRVLWRGKPKTNQRSNFIWSRLLPAILMLLIVTGLGTVCGTLSFVEERPQTHLIPIWASRVPKITAGFHGPIEDDRRALANLPLFSKVAMRENRNSERRHFLDALRMAHEVDRKEAVVLYFSAFATLDSTGNVFMIPGNSNPDNVLERIYLTQLLAEIKQLRSTKKLLVLDINWPVALPHLGMYSDDVAAEIQKTIDEHDDANLLCISSCSAGQLSWTMTTPRRSVFGYFFEQGLAGKADGWDKSNSHASDGRVSVIELATFLTSTIDEYSQKASHARQTPMLLGAGTDFDLVAYPQQPHSKPIELAAGSEMPPWLEAAWQFRDQVAAAKNWRFHPPFVSQCENEILQAEMAWRRCGNLESIPIGLDQRLKKLVSAFNQRAQPYRSPSKNDPTLYAPNPDILAAANSKPTVVAASSKDDEPPKPGAAGQDHSKTEQDKSSVLPAEHSTAQSKTAAKESSSNAASSASSSAPKTPSLEQQADDMLAKLEVFLASLKEGEETSDPKKWPQIKTKKINEFAKQIAEHPAKVLSKAIEKCLVEKPNLGRSEIMSMAMLCNKQTRPTWGVTVQVMLEIADRIGNPEGQESLPWTDSQIQQFLKLVAASEEPFERVCCWDLLGHVKARTDDQRYVVENLFWHPGYIASSVLDRRGQSAIADTVSLQALARQISFSHDVLDVSLWKLQHVFAMSGRTFKVRRSWVRSAETAGQLIQLLNQSKQTEESESVNKRVEAIESRAISLQSELEELFGSSNPDKVEAFVNGIDAGVLTTLDLRKIQDLLSTPWINVTHRRALQKALVRWPGFSGIETAVENSTTLDPRVGATTNQPQSDKNNASRRQKAREEVAVQLERLNRLASDSNSSTEAVSSLRSACYKRKWQHCATFYQKLSRDSPIASAYQGLAQQYRVQAGSNVIAMNSLPIHSTDDLLSAKNHHSSTSVPLKMGRRSFQNVAYSPSRMPEVKRKLRAYMLQPKSAALEATLLVNEKRSRLSMDISLDVSADQTSLNEIKGFFIELVDGDSIELHRVNLPGLQKSCLAQIAIAESVSQFDGQQNQIRLRPSRHRQPLCLFVKNKSDADVEWTVVANGFESTVRLGPSQIKKVVFPGKPPKPKEALPEIDARLQVSIHDKATQKLLLRKPLEVVVGSPQEYVEVVQSRFVPYPSGGNRLEVTLRAQRPIVGPECTAELILNEKLVPGLLSIQGGNLLANIPRDGKPVTLYAENLKLDEQASEYGQFEVSIDGAPRTFVFETEFARQGNSTVPTLIHHPVIGFESGKVGLAGPGLPIRVKPTNLPTDSRMELVLQRTGAKRPPDKRMLLPSPFKTRIGLAVGQQGDLLFSADIEDWQMKVDASGLVGIRQWVCEATLGSKVIARHAQPISLDDRPPRTVRFSQLPQRVAAGRRLDVSISTLSDLTSIQSVEVFTGKPVDGKLPKDAKPIACQQNADVKEIWKGQMQLPKAIGPIQLTAAATNGAGLTSFESININIVSPDSLNVGTVAGQVFESVRRQPGLEVLLVNSSGKIIAKTKSLFDGRFAFQAVPVGEYIVTTTKPASGRRGAIRVEVKPGQTTGGDISLQL